MCLSMIHSIPSTSFLRYTDKVDVMSYNKPMIIKRELKEIISLIKGFNIAQNPKFNHQQTNPKVKRKIIGTSELTPLFIAR